MLYLGKTKFIYGSINKYPDVVNDVSFRARVVDLSVEIPFLICQVFDLVIEMVLDTDGGCNGQPESEGSKDDAC